jgi:3-isopropylmalate/(R)-2-methylmalate dehydratase small subunit
LQDYGFKVVVAPRFGDIFRGNALKAGLLPVELDVKAVEELWAAIEADPAAPVTVDLQERQLRAAGREWAFPLDDFSRWRLLEGLDDIGLTLRHEEAITAFEQRRPEWTPVVH